MVGNALPTGLGYMVTWWQDGLRPQLWTGVGRTTWATAEGGKTQSEEDEENLPQLEVKLVLLIDQTRH